MLQHLATPQAETRFGHPYLVRSVAASSGSRPHEVWEVPWGLVGEGLAYLDPDIQGSGTDNWHWRLSGLGIRAVSDGAWEPRDPEGYLTRLRKQTPAIDDKVLRYVEEALRAFNARCYLATSVMLGVASERSIDCLAESVLAARGESARRLANRMKDPRASQASRFVELRKVLDPLRPTLPAGTADTLTLDAVADLLRVTRNEAGHPTDTHIDEHVAYTHLQIAARYLHMLARLTAHFSSNAT